MPRSDFVRSAILQDRDCRLAGRPATGTGLLQFPVPLPGHVHALAGETRFVSFDRIRYFLKANFRSLLAETVEHEPCRHLLHLDFVGQHRAGNAFWVRDEQADGEHPLSEFQPGLLDVCASAAVRARPVRHRT